MIASNIKSRIWQEVDRLYKERFKLNLIDDQKSDVYRTLVSDLESALGTESHQSSSVTHDISGHLAQGMYFKLRTTKHSGTVSIELSNVGSEFALFIAQAINAEKKRYAARQAEASGKQP